MLCIELYNSGLTVAEISKHPDIIFNNKMTISRILRRFIDVDTIERARRLRAATSLSRAGRKKKALANAKAIASSSNRHNVLNAISDLVTLDSSHIREVQEFAAESGLDFNPRNGIISKDNKIILILPISDIFSTYSFLARDFYQQAISTSNPLILFLDELRSKKVLISSMIDARIGSENLIRCSARQCLVRQLSSQESRAFFDNNHISGHVTGSMYVGLEFNNEIIAAISMRRPFTNRYSGYLEIARFAVKSGYIVRGAFSKLLSNIINQIGASYTHILSYCDLRYGTGNVYRVNGFTEIGRTKPDYCYTDGIRRYHRFKYRAADGRTEREIAEAAGLHRLYGVGSIIYELEIPAGRSRT
jgi:hypothetical protein